MLDYITKPTAAALNDLSNAQAHLNVSEAESLDVGGAGTFDIYVAIAGTVSVTTGSVLTAANDSDEAEFFYTGTPGGDIGVEIASGSYAGTYATDHQGNPFTLADVQSAPVCLVAPVVTAAGGLNDGDVITGTPGLWIYDGAEIAPLIRRVKLSGVEAPDTEGGGDPLAFVIDTAQHSALDFVLEETFGGATVGSNTLTVDTLTGSYMALDDNSKFWYDPAEIVQTSGTVTSWPNTATNPDTAFNLDEAYGAALPTWDVANSKMVANGTNQGISTGATGDGFTSEGGYSLFMVADAPSTSGRNDGFLFQYGSGAGSVMIGAGTSGGNLVIFSRDNSVVDGTAWGSLSNPLPMNSTVTAGTHVFEMRVTREELVEIFVDGTLQWSQAITEANSPGTELTLFTGNLDTPAFYTATGIYEVFATLSTGPILDNIRGELAAKHSITLA